MSSEEDRLRQLRESLKRVELAILTLNLEEAEKIYVELFENWKIYEETLKGREREVQECLALIEYIGKILEEKRDQLLQQLETSKVRRTYVLRSIK